MGASPPKKKAIERPLRRLGERLGASSSRAARRLARAAWPLSWGARRAVVSATILLALLAAASVLLDEPMRRAMEQGMNRSLKGYTVRLPELDFHLFRLSVTLKDLTIRQQAHPDPPVASIARLHASLHWAGLLRGRLVSDFLFDRPRIYINRPQLVEEVRDETPVAKRGWQEAALAIYPFKINLLRIRGGELTYIDDPRRPLRVSGLQLQANNIRNIHSRDRVYPSSFHVVGKVFEAGRGVLEGNANFLAKPYPGVHALMELDGVPLDDLQPLAGRANLSLRGGTLATKGEVEFAPWAKFLNLERLTLRQVRLDYIHTAKTAEAEERRKEKVAKAAQAVTDKPGVRLQMKNFALLDSELGFVNRARDPDYRAFLADTDLKIINLSNRFREGPATAYLTGKFMGGGPTRATAHFRPEKKDPDFDLRVSIEATPMTRMNDLLRAYGKFDVVAGVFSLYSELEIKEGRIRGYIKPLFQDLDVYDRRQDRDKGLFRKLYEGLVGGISNLLENPRRDQVATVAELSGPVEDPRSSTWQIIGRLIENAFFKAILPGFDRELEKGSKKSKKDEKPEKRQRPSSRSSPERSL
jgi:hypothetical protein